MKFSDVVVAVAVTALFLIMFSTANSFAQTNGLSSEDLLLRPRSHPETEKYINPWKSDDRFDFSTINGLDNDFFISGTKNIVTVEGRSNSMDVDDFSGFQVIASLFDPVQKGTYKATIFWPWFDKIHKKWVVTVEAPDRPGEGFKLFLGLFCGKKDTPCDEVYGYGTRVEKYIPITIKEKSLSTVE